ncbi:tRNA adenosine(34) deaminase TadA [bacterium]
MDKYTTYMKLALQEAIKAKEEGEVPIGAVLVFEDKVLARGFNQSIINNDPTAHAEIVCLRKASKVLNNYRLNDCSLYVTLEPCPMCAGALVHSRVAKIIYGARDYKMGSCGTVFSIAHNEKLNHRIEIVDGVMEKESREILQDFFKDRRLGVI